MIRLLQHNERIEARLKLLTVALKDCLEAFHNLNAGGYSRKARCFNPSLKGDCQCSAHKAQAALAAA